MKLRLSNGVNYAVEFNATDPASYRHNIRRAALDFFAHEGTRRPAELHVATDSGSWISPRYPQSNGPLYIYFSEADIGADIRYDLAVTANAKGTCFEKEVEAIASFIGGALPLEHKQ